MRLVALAEYIQYIKMIGEDKEILSIATDSRTCSENSLFICLKGSNTDSHNRVEEAIRKGAVAVIAERELHIAESVSQIVVENTRLALGILASAFYMQPSKYLKIIGITGTNGKTTTSYMLASILEKAGKRVGIIGTLGIKYAGKFVASDLTTPDPILLQKTLADMVICDVEYVVMEVSAHAIYYKKIAGVDFTACIFTNFTQDHLDFFQTMEQYKQTKMQFFLAKNVPIAILNGDENVGREIAKLREKDETAQTVFYGLHTPSEAFAVITNETLLGIDGMLNINDKLCRISLPMTGNHNIYNALAAATCAVELGIPIEKVGEGLNAMECVNGRLEYVAGINGAYIYVDFAHTPDGLEKSLYALKTHCRGRLIGLFGCGGNRDKSKRALMGETAAKFTDFTILTSDNPRYEDPLDIISEIEKGYRHFSVKYVVVPDRKRAIEYAVNFLKKDDVLLIAGKGAEEFQEIMGIKYPFNDKDIIEKILKVKGNNPLL